MNDCIDPFFDKFRRLQNNPSVVQDVLKLFLAFCSLTGIIDGLKEIGG